MAPRLKLVERFVDVGGFTGCYTDTGSRGRGGRDAAAPVLLLVPSMLVRWTAYLPTIRHLAPHFRVVTVELPGTGRSAKLDKVQDLDWYAKWLGGFCDALGLGRVIPVGHSNSGATLVHFARDFPDRVHAMVLADPIGADRSSSILRVFVARAIDAALELRLTLAGWHHVVYNALFHPRNFFTQVRLSVEVDITPVAAAVEAPVLLGWGANDHTMPFPHCPEILLPAFPDARLYVSRAGSHDWNVDLPAEFAAAVAQFISTAHPTRRSRHLSRGEAALSAGAVKLSRAHHDSR